MKETFSKINVIETFVFILFIILFTSCKKESDETPQCALLFPNGGEWLLKGKEYNIKWFDKDAKSVRIELYKSGAKLKTIVNSTDNSGEYLWNVPDNLDNSNDYKIMIINEEDENISDQSNSDFTIIIPNETSSFIDSRDGQEYKTVKIGDQWWMAENFNYDADSGSFCYLYEETFCKEKGRLYTWQAALDNNPEGWHLPSDEEWKSLELFLGLPPDDIDKEGFRSLYVGELLWHGGGTGFEVLLSGYYNSMFDLFGHIGYEARFWTSTNVPNDEKFWTRLLIIDQGGIDRHKIGGSFGISVRYIKDAEE